MSKAMMEKVMVAASRDLEGTGTVICGTRYGNVMASRGSVIPLFLDQVLRGGQISVTDPTMTRFMIRGREERARAEDLDRYFRVPSDARDLNYAEFTDAGETALTAALHDDDYNSSNTTRLDAAGMKALLLELDIMRDAMAGARVVAEELN